MWGSHQVVCCNLKAVSVVFSYGYSASEYSKFWYSSSYWEKCYRPITKVMVQTGHRQKERCEESKETAICYKQELMGSRGHWQSFSFYSSEMKIIPLLVRLFPSSLSCCKQSKLHDPRHMHYPTLTYTGQYIIKFEHVIYQREQQKVAFYWLCIFHHDTWSNTTKSTNEHQKTSK